jgi:hypothetical protein
MTARGNSILNLILGKKRKILFLGVFIIFLHSKEQYSHEALKFLENAGIDFNSLKNDGIDAKLFAEYAISSGRKNEIYLNKYQIICLFFF